MSASASVTVTGKSGPGVTVTAQVYTGVTSFSVDVARGILTLFGGQSFPDPKEFDISGATTFTVTISGGSYTVTIS